MRKRLMAAAAIAPLMIGFQAAYAQPALTISKDTSTPVATATAVSGAPGDVTLASGATFTIKDATPAFTLNSNNSVTNAGTITSNNVDNATGILVQGPFTGTVTNAGAISLGEDYTPSDSANTDGIAEAPFAQGSNRIGIRVTGPFTGNVNNTGSISIQGNNSTGISLENTLTGSLVSSGSIAITGNGSYGVRTTGEITGDLNVQGSVDMKGAGSVAVQSNGQVDGHLRVYGAITTTGYAITGRQTGQIQTNIQKTPTDVQQGGSALQVTGNVQGGVFLGAPPPGTVTTDTTTDADHDGVVDSVEGASSLTTYGSAPTIQVGGPSAINLGNFGTGINAYGLVIEGTVSGQGVMDGASATAVDIGAGGAGVNLNGGIRSSGNVSATAYQADATAIRLEQGVTGSQILNTGQISANVTSASANTATAIQIDAGATITSLNNSGTITASTTGDSASAVVIVDKTGAVNSVTNTGAIAAALSPALPGEAITGRGVALDLSANTTGVTLLQQNGADAAGPAILGDVLLGSGPNTVNLLAGSLTGTLSMGSAASSLTIDNGAVFNGPLLYSGNQLAINIANGSLIDKSATTVGASSLNVGPSSTLTFALDPTRNASTFFNVSGAATFASGSKISATLLSTPSLAGQTFTVLKAGALSLGAIDTSGLSNLPYLFKGSLNADTTANTISINVRTKTPTELAFNKAEAAAFNAIYTALPQDPGIQTALITATDRKGLISAYDQLLPNSSGDVFNTALGMSRAVSRAAADRFDLSTQRDEEDDEDFVVSGFWASEFYSGIEQDKQDNNGYHSAGLGVIGGYDFGGTGVTLSAASSNITRPHQVGDSLNSVSVFEGSVYAEPRFGALSIDARLGAGYLKASNRRQMVAQVVSGDLSTTSTVSRTADGDWSGYDLTAHLGAGLQLDVNRRLFFQPRIYADVFHMHENAYNERNGGLGYDFNVSARDGTQTNGTASLVTGLRFGNQFVVSPQIEVGYDKVITGGPGATTARFAYGGPAFTVAANRIDGAAMGRLTLRGDGNYVHFSLQAGGEYNSNYHSLDAKAVFRLTF
jgi:hypothetical protein